jgi:hypothetical protein
MAVNVATSPVDDLTFQAVAAFCEEQRPESIRLEYKEEWSSSKPGRQIAKEVCAFANTQGGLILLGVDEQGNRRPNPKPTGRDLGSKPRQQVIQACSAHIYPAIAPEVSDFLPNPNDSSLGFVVIRVNASREFTHAIDDGRHVYVRVHDNSEPVKPHIDQLDRMLQQRRSLASSQDARVDRAIACLHRAMWAGPETGYLAFGIGPVMPFGPVIDRRISMELLPNEHSFKQSFSEGSLSIEVDGSEGWLLDIYGNLLLAKTFDPLHRRFEVRGTILDDYGYPELQRRVRDSRLSAVLASDVLQALVRLVKAADHSTQQLSHLGHTALRLVARRIDTAPLLPEASLIWGFNRVIAFNRAEQHVDLRIESGPSLAGLLDLADTASQRLLWAWGSTHADLAATALELAEKEVYGKDQCECGKARPRCRDECWQCRRKSATAATGA